VWSGLAVGIDAAAHRAALAAAAPTVAVLAGGLDRVYPIEHEALARDIAARGGLLLSEAPPGRGARRGHFPRRNRIMAWGVDAVLVVEAGLASGSLHTAHFAAEAGVSVFAVPGPYTSRRSQGCHALIADGAQIARDPEDLLRRLGVDAALGSDAPALDLELGADETALLAVLEQGPRPSDLVQREAALPSSRYLDALLSLTGKGLVRALPGDLVAAVTARPR
jgi:DNA processing protein